MPGFNTITGDESIMSADNASFDGTARGGKMTANGQLWIGSTASPHVKLGAITSPSGTVNIGYSSPNITLDITGGSNAIEKVNVDTTTGAGTNPVLPNAGAITISGGQYSSGTFGTRVITIVSPAANQLNVEAQISSAQASSLITANGLAHFNSANFTVDANGFVTGNSLSPNYTNVTHAMSPYTVLAADQYISVDCSGGVVTLNFPNAPTAKRTWTIKDRTGSAATSNITLTTPGGTVTFDGVTSYKLISNFASIQLLANATPTYEVN